MSVWLRLSAQRRLHPASASMLPKVEDSNVPGFVPFHLFLWERSEANYTLLRDLENAHCLLDLSKPNFSKHPQQP